MKHPSSAELWHAIEAPSSTAPALTTQAVISTGVSESDSVAPNSDRWHIQPPPAPPKVEPVAALPNVADTSASTPADVAEPAAHGMELKAQSKKPDTPKGATISRAKAASAEGKVNRYPFSGRHEAR